MNNKNNFENEVLDFLNKKGGATKDELVKYLQAKHPDGNGYERGYSSKNLDTRLGKLVDQGILLTIQDQEELNRFGIKKKDGRASYYFSKTSTEIKDHVDFVFNHFDKGDSEDKLAALAEIDSYKKVYLLNPLQLDVLVRNLDEKDIELSYQLLVVLHYYIIEKDIKPNDTSSLLSNLKDILANYPPLSQKRPALRGFIIALLGVYNNQAVVDQLIEDANKIEDLSSVKDEYDKSYTARVIEKYRTELFNLERDLRKNAREKNAKILSQIRYQAKKHSGMVDNDDDISVPGVDSK